MEYLYGTLPFVDAATVPFSVMEQEAAHALRLLQENPWRQALPEDIFFHFVLCPRVNDEHLELCRAFFYGELMERVRHLPLADAVLAANLWCCEQVTYEASDERTQSPLATYRAGKGRCGEESVFTVAVLRSLGIAARQVYAPFWSHCDDNHAWVEAYVDGAWRFFGACEPEPCLDRGWFLRASSRAMLVHARAFSGFAGEGLRQESLIERRGDVFFYNETARYAPTRCIAFTVNHADGTPAAGALLHLQVLNMAAYRTIAVLTADACGKAAILCGKGSLHVAAVSPLGSAAFDVAPGGDVAVALTLSAARAAYVGCKGFLAPGAAPKTAPAPSEAALKENQNKTQTAATLRAARLAAYYDAYQKEHAPPAEQAATLAAACGNVGEIGRFLFEQPPERMPWAKKLLDTLPEKDLRDAPCDVLNHHLEHALRFWPQHRAHGSVFAACLLSPRIGTEHLRPWRSVLLATLTEEERAAFSAAPEKLAQAVHAGRGSARNKIWHAAVGLPPDAEDALFVALARAIGICARLHPLTQKAEYFMGGTWTLAWPGENPSPPGMLCLEAEAPAEWHYAANWSISKLEQGGFTVLRAPAMALQENTALTLAPGTYRVVVTNRLPNGNQLAHVQEIRLQAGEAPTCRLALPMAQPEQMLQHTPLEDFCVATRDGTPVQASSLCKAGQHALFAFLRPGAEPTEHFLAELRENMRQFSGIVPVLILCGNAGQSAPALQRFLNEFPEVPLYADASGGVHTHARNMFLEPESLPVVTLVAPPFTGIYGYCGYAVGGVQMAMKLSRLKMETP